MQLQILMSTYDMAIKIRDMVDNIDLVVTGIEYNAALGLEQIRLFKPQIIILDSELPVIGVEEYIKLISDLYFNHGSFIVILVEPSIKFVAFRTRYVYTTIRSKDLNRDYLTRILSDIISIFESRNKVINKITGANVFESDTLMLGDGKFNELAVNHLINTHKFNPKLFVNIVLLRPKKQFWIFENSLDKKNILLYRINQLLARYGDGFAVLMENRILNIIIKAQNIRDKEFMDNKLFFEIRFLIEEQTHDFYTFFISKPIQISKMGYEYKQMLDNYKYGFFTNNSDLIYNNNQYFNKDIIDLDWEKYQIYKNFNIRIFLSAFINDRKKLEYNINKLYIYDLKSARSFSELFYANLKLELVSETICFLLLHKNKFKVESPFRKQFTSIESMCKDVKEWFCMLIEIYNQKENRVNELIIQTAAHLIDNYMLPVSQSSVASKIHISDSYLSHLFKNETKDTFSAYVSKLRICSAKSFIRHTDKKIADIAVTVGFADYRYFSQLFKKSTEMSPVQYRGYCHNGK